MPGELHIAVRTPEGAVWQGEGRSLRIPAPFGSFGVLPNHAPLTALTGDGILEIHSDEGTRWIVLASGIVEIARNTVTLLTDAALPASDEADADEKLEALHTQIR